MALVMPLLSHLGYDVHDPREICPEFICDVGEKKKERVDYAIMQDGKPIILIECKQYGGCLDLAPGTQLERYFNTTFSHVAVLTDGNRYRFFTDLEARNRMDKVPYMEFTLESMDEGLIPEVFKLAKGRFDPATAMSAATDLKYTREFRKILEELFQEPDEEFVRFLVGKADEREKDAPRRRFTPGVIASFSPLVKRAMQRWINSKINERLKSAIQPDEEHPANAARAQEIAPAEELGDKIVTTDEEWQAFFLVKSILLGTVAPERIFIRDAQTYCSVFFDDNNRQPICRFWFNARQKYIGLFDKGDPNERPRQEDRIPIDTLDEILPLADRLRETAKRYL